MESTTLQEGTFGPILEGLRSLIPRTLLDGGGWDRLVGRIGNLPGDAVADTFGFEFRLDDGSQEADFVVPIAPGGELQRYFIRTGKAAPAGSPEYALGSHLEHAVEDVPGPPADDDGGERLLLEYDIGTAGLGRCPPPGIFLRCHNAEPGHLVDMLADAIGVDRDPAEREAVERAGAVLPPKGVIVQVGMLPGREPRAIRVVAGKIEADELGPFLQRLGGSGAAEAVAAILPEVRDLFHTVWLSFDVVAGGVGPRVGVEIGPSGDGPADGPGCWTETTLSDWRPLIHRLETLGWCLPEKARALRAWPGRDTIFEDRGVYFMYRGINHAKVVVDGSSVSAKGYVGATYSPLKPRTPDDAAAPQAS